MIMVNNDTFVDFETEIVLEMFTEMQEFIARIESYIRVD
jgi:hypothetical protein